MLLRVLPISLLLGGLGLLGLAAFGYFAPAADLTVTIDQQEQIVSDAKVGQLLPVAFRIRNPTDRAVRVVGLAEC
jgi:hypothetical protein